MGKPKVARIRLMDAFLRLIAPAVICFFIAASGHYVRAAIGPDNFGYTAATTTFSFQDLTTIGTGVTPILDFQDDAAVTVPIGFPFIFYGVIYTSVSVSSNGLITFQGADTAHTPVNIATTSTLQNLPTIAVLWHDWTFQYFGSDEVYYATLGAAGSRRLIIQWNFAQSKSGPGTDTITFEVKLFEGSNNIEFHYLDATVSDDPNVSNGKDATVGIRDINGQTSGRNLKWSFNQTVIADGQAIRFVAPVFKVTSITRLANRHILLQCLGAPSLVNYIEASPNLNPGSFSTLGSATANASGVFQFEDVNAGSFTRRFYRVAVP